ncbi:protein-disulfide isomerase [Kibdelosporangium banguiense]|uniref:Protein-disulfide isomerase n=1 Tax=Kibdelosporangium banguiense TaxID=1365924 RepID=A0ABS4TZ91_9PSEU|nr:thioredoxin domain-containing protein [Kibdelosporangium banguiense]MBP2329732.1 protein-disulfide isomerase [Kibdelosporangium banguiense]
MTSNTKISLTVLAVVAVVVTGILLLNRPDTPPNTGSQAQQPNAPAAQLVRPDSHRLSNAADGKVTVVEFLDLECEACGAAYPGVEKLRAEYGDKVTFVMRYFPIPSHRNAELSARAVEAAGQQGKLEGMYKLMYENQPLWGDQDVSHRDTFLGFARQLGLDMPAFEAALDAKATLDRVLADRNDGTALGVRGTPTFFINGTKFAGRPSYEALKSAVDAELAK